MFENLIRELESLGETTQVSIPIEPDSEGFYDKECPVNDCCFQFKVHTEDWGNIVRDEEVFCPSCGHSAPADSWFTESQIEAAKEYALNSVKNRLNNAMRADAAASKRRQNRNSFLSITLSVSGTPDNLLLPIGSAEPMRLRTSCETCGCRYSYVGAAYFCPSCGQNSANHTFFQTLSTIRAMANIDGMLRSTLEPDNAEVAIRSLLEKAIQDTVMSFQRLNEQLYEKHTGKTPKRNAFQRLSSGSELWQDELGESYSDLVTTDKMSLLNKYFQQRHLLSHQQGIVDQDYVSRSWDKSYVVGQRLIIRKQAVLEFADLIEELANGIIAKMVA